MELKLQILKYDFLQEYKTQLGVSPEELLKDLEKTKIQVDYFQFYNSVSSVYSSKIEGVEIDFDSFFKHKFMGVKYKPDYTRKADDLYLAYDFILKNQLSNKNIIKAHKILSNHLLPKSQQGLIRTSQMFVLNNNDEIEYVAAYQKIVKTELDKLFSDIEALVATNLDSYEIFYFASLIHLVFVKIHPFYDGNGRTARLLEKWFLVEKLGKDAVNIRSEKYYYSNLPDYYANIKLLGLEYDELKYENSLPFLLMLAKSLMYKKE